MPNQAAPPPSVRLMRAGVIALVVLVFALVVLAVSVASRAELRDQVPQREARILATFVGLQLERSASELKEASPALADVPGVLLAAVLKTLARFPDVVGVRVFNDRNELSEAFPIPWSSAPASAEHWARLAAGEPIGRLHARVVLAELIEVAPAFEVWVPLRAGGTARFIGAAQFVIHGRDVAAEMRAHDGRLVRQAIVAWVGGSIAIVLALRWAFRRLDAANHALRARTDDLERANRELVLAAKTSALGAVTAHLVHELKNPLAGLETLVSGQADAAGAQAAGGELAAASELTRRLRTMVNDVVAVLRDEQTGADFELTSVDIAEVAAGKVQAEAAQRGLELQVIATGDVAFPARRANLATLVLRNLLQNALEASPPGQTVRLTARRHPAGGAEFLVEDHGRGLPPEVRARAFQPCNSTKVGGSGLGLALSHQLAQRAGATLEVVRSDELGTCFRLALAPEP